MSEYQYYEFRSLDRPLSHRQMQELRALSSRAEITPSRFVNVYHWGDLRGDPDRIMEAYFDIMVYATNWGTFQLMLRVPKGLLELNTAQQYLNLDLMHAWQYEEYTVLSITSWEEGGWVDRGQRIHAAAVAASGRGAAG